nr:alpha/beta hydrolase fold domain-containing protein [Bacilli bacterium]
MKVTRVMIDRDLRFYGMLMKWVMPLHDERRFLRLATRQQLRNVGSRRRRAHGLDLREVFIERDDHTTLRLLIIAEKTTGVLKPGILWLHGGGYALGSPDDRLATYRRLQATRDCVIVAPDYRLSREKPYPAAVDDAYLALTYLYEHAKEWHVDEKALMVGGESAGGGLALGLAILARDRGVIPIVFAMPLYPMIDDRMQLPSAVDNDAPVWNSQANQIAWKWYLRDLIDGDVPVYAAPARLTDYRGLPPMVTFVGDLEPFRDETIAFVHEVKKAGIPVFFSCFPGCFHAFDIVNPRAAISKKATRFWLDAFAHAVDQYVQVLPIEK